MQRLETWQHQRYRSAFLRCRWLPMLAFLNLRRGATSFCQSRWWLQCHKRGIVAACRRLCALNLRSEERCSVESSLSCHHPHNGPIATDTRARSRRSHCCRIAPSAHFFFLRRPHPRSYRPSVLLQQLLQPHIFPQRVCRSDASTMLAMRRHPACVLAIDVDVEVKEVRHAL